MVAEVLARRPVLVGVSSASSSDIGHAVLVVGARFVLWRQGTGFNQLLVADPVNLVNMWLSYSDLVNYLSPSGKIMGTVTIDP